MPRAHLAFKPLPPSLDVLNLKTIGAQRKGAIIPCLVTRLNELQEHVSCVNPAVFPAVQKSFLILQTSS